jgi:hypothetical protein
LSNFDPAVSPGAEQGGPDASADHRPWPFATMHDIADFATDFIAAVAAFPGVAAVSTALVLVCIVSAVAGGRLAGAAGSNRFLWFLLGLVPILGQVALAYLATQPDREVVRHLERIEDYLIRGIPPEQLQRLLLARAGSVPPRPMGAELYGSDAGDRPRAEVATAADEDVGGLSGKS